jgi:hypothetical protein
VIDQTNNAIVAPKAAITAHEASIKGAIAGLSTIIELRPNSLALAQNGLKVQALIDAVSADIEIAATLEIDSPDMLTEAEQIAGRLAGVCADSGGIENERKALTAPFNDLVKEINAGYNAPKVFIGSVLDGLRTKILAYNREQKRLADIQAEADRKKREEDLRLANERETAATADAQKLLGQAAEATAAGNVITAGALVAEAGVKIDAARADATAAVTAMHTRTYAAPIARAKGVRGKWQAEVVDLSSLILHVAKRIEAGDKSLVNLLVANDSALNAKAAIEKEGFALPGTKAEFVESLSVRKVAVAA